MRNLGPRFSISDVALKKIFTKANIPVPERGYWAKREAGKKAVQRPLPPRSPGVDDKFLVGGDGQYGRFEPTDQEILGSAPEPPLFAEPIETVRERVYKQISKVRMPKAVAALHPAISACLEADECRRQKQRAGAHWEKPIFEGPIERRRLRLLNSLFPRCRNGRQHLFDRRFGRK